jgi:hypothetical protein
MWTHVDFLNFGKKGRLLEVLKDELGDGKKREKYVVMVSERGVHALKRRENTGRKFKR